MTDQTTPKLDPSKIDFPTDSITWGQMRRAEPGVLDNLDSRYDGAGNDIYCTHQYELKLAEKAFAKAAGLSDPRPNTPRHEIVEILRGAYSDWGLGKGHVATEALRAIERAAAEQATQARGR